MTRTNDVGAQLCASKALRRTAHQDVDFDVGFRHDHLHRLEVTRFGGQMQRAHAFVILRKNRRHTSMQQKFP